MSDISKNDIICIVENVVNRYLDRDDLHISQGLVPLEVSARHVHLSREAVVALFGEGAELTPQKSLSQPGQFLSEQRVKVVTNGGSISNVAVLGPERSETQVEISLTDARVLGIKVPVNLSGNLKDGASVLLVGPVGFWHAGGSTIAAQSHMHMSSEEAQRLILSDGDIVRVFVESNRPLTLERVVVRVSNAYAPAIHIDADEANACAFEANLWGRVLRK